MAVPPLAGGEGPVLKIHRRWPRSPSRDDKGRRGGEGLQVLASAQPIFFLFFLWGPKMVQEALTSRACRPLQALNT